MICNPISWFCVESVEFLVVFSLSGDFCSYCSCFMIPLLFFPLNLVFSSQEETVSHFWSLCGTY